MSLVKRLGMGVATTGNFVGGVCFGLYCLLNFPISAHCSTSYEKAPLETGLGWRIFKEYEDTNEDGVPDVFSMYYVEIDRTKHIGAIPVLRRDLTYVDNNFDGLYEERHTINLGKDGRLLSMEEEIDINEDGKYDIKVVKDYRANTTTQICYDKEGNVVGSVEIKD